MSAEGLGETSGIKAVVADIVQPPPELETAVEAVLGERLGNIIVESHEVGVEAIEFLKPAARAAPASSLLALRVAGAAPGTVVYDAAAGCRWSGAVRSASLASDWDDDAHQHDYVHVVGIGGDRGVADRGGRTRPMLELIGYDRAVRRVATYLLGDVLVVRGPDARAGAVAPDQTDKTIVTLDGEVIDPHGVVTGGSRESAVAGVLEQKREIRELEEVVARSGRGLSRQALARQVATKQELADVTDDASRRSTAVLRQDEMALVCAAEGSRPGPARRRRLEAAAPAAGRRGGELRAVAAPTEERLHEARQRRWSVDRHSCSDGETLGSPSCARRPTALAEQVDALVGELTAAEGGGLAGRGPPRPRPRHPGAAAPRARRAAKAGARAWTDHRRGECTRAETLRAEAVSAARRGALAQAEAEARAPGQAERAGRRRGAQRALSRREAELRAARDRVGQAGARAVAPAAALPGGDA